MLHHVASHSGGYHGRLVRDTGTARMYLVMAIRHVPETFYRIRTLKGVLGYSLYMGPGVKPCG